MLEDKTFVVEGYRTPVCHYPKTKLGKVEIGKRRIKKSDVFWAEGVRGKLFYRHDRTFMETTLKIGGQVWMTSGWTYVESLASFAERAKGQVLVAGLGLGIVVHQLVRNPAVTEIKVIELEMDVIRLVQPLLPEDPRIQIVHDDFDRFIDAIAGQDDYVPDTVIWDLAVSGDGVSINTGRVPFLHVLIAAKIGDHYIRDGKWTPRKNPKRDAQVFVHGLDRDPEGEEFESPLKPLW